MVPTVKPYIQGIQPYSPPWTKLDRTQYLRLDLNENIDPLPPPVLEALKQEVERELIGMYPEYDEFLEELAPFVGVSPQQVLISNGSDQAIELILRSFLSAGDEMVIARPEFPIFSQVASVIGATVNETPYLPDLSFPEDAFLNSISSKTQLIVLINPNNPTGTPISQSYIEKGVVFFSQSSGGCG